MGHMSSSKVCNKLKTIKSIHVKHWNVASALSNPTYVSLTILTVNCFDVFSHRGYLENWFQFLDYLVNIKLLCKCQVINVSVRHLKNVFATH